MDATETFIGREKLSWPRNAHLTEHTSSQRQQRQAQWMNDKVDQSDQSFSLKKNEKQKKIHHSSYEISQFVVRSILSDSAHLFFLKPFNPTNVFYSKTTE